VIGANILTAFSIAFHAYSVPAFAVFACEK